MQGVPLPAPESDREIRLLTREVYCDKLAVKERFIRINLKGDGRWKSCLTGEYRLMEVLWESAPVNSTQLVTLCREQLGWTKSTTYTVLRKLCRKGAARNERAVVTPLLTREQVIRAQGEELAVKAGGMAPFLNAFFSGRKLTMEEALELKDLIDQHTWED